MDKSQRDAGIRMHTNLQIGGVGCEARIRADIRTKNAPKGAFFVSQTSAEKVSRDSQQTDEHLGITR